MNDSDVYLGRAPRLGRLTLENSGKVRDIYAVDAEHLLFVTSDRVSAFDVVMPQGIPHKGRVLTSIAAHWFARTKDVIPNHLVSTRPEDVPGLTPKEHELLRGRMMHAHRDTEIRHDRFEHAHLLGDRVAQRHFEIGAHDC